MFSVVLGVLFAMFVVAVTWVSYKIATTKFNNPVWCAIAGFILAFLPPIALIYLIILLRKDDRANNS
ncbi:MAG: hypothetical protein NWQ26_04555 [Paraglaciecola sp.]|nr:hypothetical protein [Paraglaciecola sp.]